MALAAVDDAGKALGADLEAVEPRSDAFVRDYFTRREIAAVEAGERDLLANLIWSAKESALKALGAGLTLDTRAVEVELGPGAGEGWRALRVHGAAELSGWWRLRGTRIVTLVGASAGEPALIS